MGHRHWTGSKQDHGLISLSLQLANEDNDCDSGVMGSLGFCLGLDVLDDFKGDSCCILYKKGRYTNSRKTPRLGHWEGQGWAVLGNPERENGESWVRGILRGQCSEDVLFAEC